MKYILTLFLTRFAVMCVKTSNSFIVEMPDDLPSEKPFRVYWNVPSFQCKSKNILFHLSKFGIIQNKDDVFQGNRISILYEPGDFPAILKNGTLRNGGAPQEGDLKRHLEKLKADIQKLIPNPDFDGVGIIDFENWRPVFRQNYGNAAIYVNFTYELERRRHWWWPKQWIQAEGKRRFEHAAREFMQSSISIAKQMRPKAIWGYYGFPYCFNTDKDVKCGDRTKSENDEMYWLFSESTALYPSVYSSKSLSTYSLVKIIWERVKEASRVRSPWTPILPYFWYRYRDGGFMSEADLNAVLDEFYNSKASGFIIWGASDDVNTVQKCKDLSAYVENVLGPAIAKYTKDTRVEDDENLISGPADTSSNDTSAVYGSKTFRTPDNPVRNVYGNSDVQFIIDPEHPMQPPDNYSQAISYYMKTPGYNELVHNTTLEQLDNKLLLDIIVSSISKPVDVDSDSYLRNSISNSISGVDITSQNVTEDTLINVTDDSAIVSIIKYLLERNSSYLNSVVTSDPLERFNTFNESDSSSVSLRSSSNDEQTTALFSTIENPTTKSIYNDLGKNNDDKANEFATTAGLLLLLSNTTSINDNNSEDVTNLLTTKYETSTNIMDTSETTQSTTGSSNFDENSKSSDVTEDYTTSGVTFEEERTSSQFITGNDTFVIHQDTITDNTTEFSVINTSISPTDNNNLQKSTNVAENDLIGHPNAKKSSTNISTEFMDNTSRDFLTSSITDNDEVESTQFVSTGDIKGIFMSTKSESGSSDFEGSSENNAFMWRNTNSDYFIETESTTSQLSEINIFESLDDINDNANDLLIRVTSSSLETDSQDTSATTEYEPGSTQLDHNLMNTGFLTNNTILEEPAEGKEFTPISTDVEGMFISTESTYRNTPFEDSLRNSYFSTAKADENFENKEFVTSSTQTKNRSNNTKSINSSIDLGDNSQTEESTTHITKDEDNLEITNIVTDDQSLESVKFIPSGSAFEENSENITNGKVLNEFDETVTTRIEDSPETNTSDPSLAAELEQVISVVNLIP